MNPPMYNEYILIFLKKDLFANSPVKNLTQEQNCWLPALSFNP
jgi:hypothetical protein